MDLTLLSGVVRNRKQMTGTVSRSQALFEEGQTETPASHNTIDHLRTYISKNSIFRKFHLRVHKFTFQWELALHLVICILSLSPFFFTGKRSYSLIPISVWLFYNILFLIGPQFANKVIPRFGKLKLSFKSTIEDFFSPKLLPVLSISFLCVVLSLAVTGHRLGGPPLCYHPCSVCLAAWQHSVPLSAGGGGLVAAAATVTDTRYTSSIPEDPLLAASTRVDPLVDAYHIGCGYANGKEMLAYYTMSQTSFTLFFVVVVALTVCLAWRVAEDERQERRSAEEWLKSENTLAYQLRTKLVEQLGAPGSSVRPEGSATWIFFGVTAALTFTLLGWHNWSVLPPSNTATLLIILNLLTILMSTLILHLSFFGRLLALYKRNYLRVQALTHALSITTKEELDSWWNCRNFVLNDDLSLDYDMGGLAVSATFLIALTLFAALITQIYREGLQTMLEPPGSYLAYACMYITCCLIKLFTLATNTYEEQHRHIAVLQSMSNSFHYQGAMSTDYNEYGQLKTSPGPNRSGRSGQQQQGMWAAASEDDSDTYLTGEGALLIEDEEELAGGNIPNIGIAATGYNHYAAAPSTAISAAVNPPTPGRPGSPASPRRGGFKVRGSASALTSLSASYDSSDKLPSSSILKTGLSSGGTAGTVVSPSNWLGKSIFSSFKVGFDRSADASGGRDTRNNEDETTQSAAAVGGGLEVSSGQRLAALGDTSGTALPRPVHTDVHKQALSIDTDMADRTGPDSTTRDSASENKSKIPPFFDTVGGGGAAVTASALQMADQVERLAASHDSFVGVYTNTPPPVAVLSTAVTSAAPSIAHAGSAGSSGGLSSSFALRNSNSGVGLSKLSGSAMFGTSNSMPPRGVLSRSVSHNASVESYRQTIAEIISQIRRYDPYPCILGIPIMPALFNSSKFYIFIGFMLIGMRIMVACLRQV